MGFAAKVSKSNQVVFAVYIIIIISISHYFLSTFCLTFKYFTPFMLF